MAKIHRKKNNTKTLFLISGILVALFIISIAINALFNTHEVATKHLPTYFSYTAEELTRIKQSQPTNNSLSVDTLAKLDEKMFDDVITNNNGPTFSARYYAYILVAQSDAYNLALNANLSSDTITKTTQQVTCVFFQDHCPAPDNSSATDNVIAQIITKKVYQRYEDDANQTAQATKDLKPGDEKWYVLDTITPDAGYWKTWLINSPHDFLAPPPPQVGSQEDQDNIEAVKTALKNNTPEQIEKVKYWAGGANTITPSGMWIKFANEYMQKNNVALARRIEVRSNLAMTMADTFISCWFTKFTYWSDRPFMRSTDIHPIIQTPNFPSYTSGHSAVSASAATLLSYYFPENGSKWNDMATEAKDSRLWAGIHFPVDNEEGFKMGTKIGTSVIEKLKH